MQNVCAHSVYWTRETRRHHRFPRALRLGGHCPAVWAARRLARHNDGHGASPAQHRARWHPVHAARPEDGHGEDLVVPAPQQPRGAGHDRAAGRRRRPTHCAHPPHRRRENRARPRPDRRAQLQLWIAEQLGGDRTARLLGDLQQLNDLIVQYPSRDALPAADADANPDSNAA